MEMCMCEKVLEEAAKQGLQEQPVLITRDIIPMTPLPWHCTQEDHGGMHCLWHDHRVFIPFRQQHRWLVSRRSCTHMPASLQLLKVPFPFSCYLSRKTDIFFLQWQTGCLNTRVSSTGRHKAVVPMLISVVVPPHGLNSSSLGTMQTRDNYTVTPGPPLESLCSESWGTCRLPGLSPILPHCPCWQWQRRECGIPYLHPLLLSVLELLAHPTACPCSLPTLPPTELTAGSPQSGEMDAERFWLPCALCRDTHWEGGAHGHRAVFRSDLEHMQDSPEQRHQPQPDSPCPLPSDGWAKPPLQQQQGNTISTVSNFTFPSVV